MLGNRTFGLSHLYLDKTKNNYSNVGVGLLIRAVGYNLKIGYIDIFGRINNFISFLENLFSSKDYFKNFDNFLIDIFSFEQNNLILKHSIFGNKSFLISKEIFWDSLEDYDLIIFDKCSFRNISKLKILNLLKKKSKKTEIVFIFSNEREFFEIKDDFDLVSKFNIENKTNISSKKSIISITGNGKGKSTYCFGYLIKKFIERENIKLIYFDKGGDFYGERIFFDILKDFSITNKSYGNFDYFVTGLKRFDGKLFRFENNKEDILEAKRGLEIFKTQINKQTIIIAEEMNTTIKTGLLQINEIIEILNLTKYKIIITGKYCPEEIKHMSTKIIRVEKIKHYFDNNYSVRCGIDF